MVDQRDTALGGDRATRLHVRGEPDVGALAEPIDRGIVGPARLGHEDRLDAAEEQTRDDRLEVALYSSSRIRRAGAPCAPWLSFVPYTRVPTGGGRSATTSSRFRAWSVRSPPTPRLTTSAPIPSALRARSARVAKVSSGRTPARTPFVMESPRVTTRTTRAPGSP